MNFYFAIRLKGHDLLHSSIDSNLTGREKKITILQVGPQAKWKDSKDI